ncbi:MAG: TIGR02646 family protein [Verrucomicrobia bacterium]|nr:TIGR02646 family protein [Verrucomicrobiota bacterium]
MRHLPLHPEPTQLTVARPGLQPDWKQIPRPVKRAIRDRLYRHQFGLCGYCEGSLGELGRHIEHVEPKGGIGGNPARTFDYSNLIASCQGDTDKPKRAGQDASCGHFKDQCIRTQGAFSLGDFISPRESGCDQKFKYLSDGRVIPAAQLGTPDHSRAEYTIKVAGLDCHRLRNRRRQIAGKIIRQISRLHNDPVHLQSLANHYLQAHSDSNGTDVLLSFYSTRKQRFFPVT